MRSTRSSRRILGAFLRLSGSGAFEGSCDPPRSSAFAIASCSDSQRPASCFPRQNRLRMVPLVSTTESRALSDRVGSAGPAFRLVAAVIIAAGASLVQSAPRSSQVQVAMVIAFGWIPLAGVLAIIGRRRPHRALLIVDVALDFGLLVAA